MTDTHPDLSDGPLTFFNSDPALARLDLANLRNFLRKTPSPLAKSRNWITTMDTSSTTFLRLRHLLRRITRILLLARLIRVLQTSEVGSTTNPTHSTGSHPSQVGRGQPGLLPNRSPSQSSTISRLKSTGMIYSARGSRPFGLTVPVSMNMGWRWRSGRRIFTEIRRSLRHLHLEWGAMRRFDISNVVVRSADHK